MDRLEQFKNKGVDPAIMQIVLLDEIAGRLEELAEKGDRLKTILNSHLVERRNITVNGEETIIDKQGYGVLQELMLKAESREFQVYVYSDMDPLIYGSYDRYAGISPQVEEVDAFEVDGVYVFRVSDIDFEERLIVKISTTAPIRFQAIFAKYKISQEPHQQRPPIIRPL